MSFGNEFHSIPPLYEKDPAQSDSYKMVGFASPRSFKVILQKRPSKNVTVQYKERTCKRKSAGGAT